MANHLIEDKPNFFYSCLLSFFDYLISYTSYLFTHVYNRLFVCLCINPLIFISQNLTICESKYEYEPRGPSCYCTMFHGCYHKHFHVKPKLADIGKDAGLIVGNDKGVHDSDYVIEIKVINNALIKSTAVKKVKNFSFCSYLNIFECVISMISKS